MWSEIWRLAVGIADWRTWIRRLFNVPILDVIFITNLRDDVDRSRYIGKKHPKEGHFDGPRYWIKGVAGRTRIINSVSSDLKTVEGCHKAKQQFISAVYWAKKRGVKVVLLAAGTKRLFGKDGHVLKELFPDIIFTLGDNGTSAILQAETSQMIEKYELSRKSRMMVIGPTGILGGAMVSYFKKNGYDDIVGVGQNIAALNKIKQKYEMDVYINIQQAGTVDLVVACTHNNGFCLTASDVKTIKNPGKKLLVLDVAEPSNFKQLEYEKVKDISIRQDAGNAYSKDLKYVLGAISYKMLRLSRGVTFGCFAEAMAITHALKSGNEKIFKANFFDINDDNIRLVSELFEDIGFITSSPRSFGEDVVFCDIYAY